MNFLKYLLSILLFLTGLFAAIFFLEKSSEVIFDFFPFLSLEKYMLVKIAIRWGVLLVGILGGSYQVFKFYNRYYKSKILTGVQTEISSYKETIENLSDETVSINKQILAKEKKAKIDFQRNLKSTFLLIDLQTKNLSFFSNLKWEFQPRINILLGKNGYGKSHLLRTIVGLLQENKKTFDVFSPSDRAPEIRLSMERNETVYDIFADSELIKNPIGKIPVMAIPDSRSINKAIKTVSLPTDDLGELKNSGAYHFLNDATYEGMIHKFLANLCIESLNNKGRLDSPILKLITETVQNLTDKSFSFHRISGIEGEAKFKIEVLTEGNEKNPIPLQKASQGTLSVLAMFGLIYSFLKNVWPNANEKDVFTKPAIVIIDEIDAHLHPTWEQKIVRLFRDTFPNIQFLMTAHSPLVASGCFEKEVSILRKGNDGFYLEQIPNHLIGENTIDLYRRLFEVTDVDENYKYLLTKVNAGADNSDRINELEDKNNLTYEERIELDRLYSENRLLSQFDDIKRQKNDKDYKKQVRILESKVRRLESQLEKVKNI